MEFASMVINPVVESLMVPIKKQIGYVISSTTYVSDMRAKMKILEGKEVDVQTHMEANNRNNLVIPARVPEWLIEVKKIKEDVESISTNGSTCFNVKMKYKTGKRASKITQDIKSHIEEINLHDWTNSPIPLARVNSTKASTSAPLGSDARIEFKSRDMIFKDALKFLVEDQKTQLIALCGMGGVGKTTMMKQLKEVVDNKTMFHWIVNTSIGQNNDPVAIQNAITAYTGNPLPKEATKEAGAEHLHKRFMKMSKEGKERILVIMDDVWGMVNLDDIGLNPLPKGLKLLLTSRDENVCKQIAVKANLVFEVIRVDVLEEGEAHDLFCRIAGVSEESNQNRFRIGHGIVTKCRFLPFAINLIATTLKFKDDCHWRDALNRLKNNDLDWNLQEIFEMSYNSLKNDEIKEIFLLCGLFPDDFDIPVEELTRYAWGLQLLDKVPALKNARDKTRSYMNDLKSANLLIASDCRGCVKMHDLVLAFVLSVVSKREHPWIVNHGNMSESSWIKLSEPCERISLTCTGMSEFPGDLKHEYPNLSFLKLMGGDESLLFPEHFYGRMKGLKHIAFENMQYPSLQFSTNLRTLCLHSCLLLDEFSHIGSLTNLEILSFANSGIRELPSTIRNLKQLKLLDLTGCIDLHINDGILENLVRLEELYMRVANRKAIKFTDKNCKELEKLSRNFFALEVEFFQNNVEPKNVSCKELERFRISIGCFLKENEDQDIYFFENTLMLVTNREELLESRINELFHKTDVLHLQVVGMNNLEDVSMKSLDHSRQSFHNLRVLIVSECLDVTYLFSFSIVKGLSQLEHLEISGCPNLEELVHIEDNESELITFQKLKFLSLRELPKLVSLCRKVDVTDLLELVELVLEDLPNFTSIFPKNKTTTYVSSNISTMQSFFSEKVATPKLAILRINRMKKLKEIWSCQISSNEKVNICRLRMIKVVGCDSLVNLFPSNPMRWLRHLEELDVSKCGLVEMIFDLDLGCFHEIKEYNNNLRRIILSELGKLKEVWRMRGVNNSHPIINGFQGVTNIDISSCKSFRNLFTPATVNFNLGAVENINILGCEVWGESEKKNEVGESNTSISRTTDCHELKDVSDGETSGVENNIPNVAFPSHLLSSFHHLNEITLKSDKGVDVMFDIENNQQPLLPHFKHLELLSLERMNHVWRCNWNKLLIPQQLQPESSFHNLTNISMSDCHRIKYLFSPLMAKLLSNLKNIKIEECFAIEEIVSNRDDEDTKMATSTTIHPNTALFPHLETLTLYFLQRLARIGGGVNNTVTSNIITTYVDEQFQHPQVVVDYWSLCQYSTKIRITCCPELSSVLPSQALGQLQKLQELEICNCDSMMELFETEELEIDYCESLIELFETEGVVDVGGSSTEGSEGSGTVTMPRMTNMTLLQLLNLKILIIYHCRRLRHIFTFSTLESLKQLIKLEIRYCNKIQVIVKEEDGEHTTTSNVVVFPRLRSIELVKLPDLKGFFMGMNDFQWPLLDEVKIKDCPKVKVFTSGHSTTPKLNYIHTEFGKYSLEYGLNFHLTPTNSQKTQIPSLDISGSCPTFGGIPCSFSNLVEVNVVRVTNMPENLIPSNVLLQLKMLEKIFVWRSSFEAVFQASNGTDTGLNESQSVVIIPKLRQVELNRMRNLKCIWKSNQWTVMKFPSLTRLDIQWCPNLKHVFSCSMVGSLFQLQDLCLYFCRNMESIVKEAEDYETKTEMVMFPCLKSLKLESLHQLKGFYLGKEAITWPSLDALVIKRCPEITVFTNGKLTTPELKVIDTSFGRCYVKEDLNSFINRKKQKGFKF